MGQPSQTVLVFTGVPKRDPAPRSCPRKCRWRAECKRRPACADPPGKKQIA